tara:strand:+ start:1791 stop:2027 length:237 start_codon:yes stop_codon:yes gene_type:complete
MHPRERLLAKAKLLRLKRKEPLPLDFLAKAEELGIMIEILGENTNLPHLTEEGEFEYVIEEQDNIHNNEGDRPIPMAK